MNLIDNLARPLVKDQKQLIIVSPEGRKTERKYFNHLNSIQEKFEIRYAEYIDSAPEHVLDALKIHVNKKNYDSDVEFWVVIDRDQRTDVEKFEAISKWCKENSQYNMAVSDPCFELWYIYHHALDQSQLEEIKEFGGDQIECIEFCRKYFNYTKNRPKFNRIEFDDVKHAVKYAKKIDTTNESGWPVEPGCTTVYRVVESYCD